MDIIHAKDFGGCAGSTNLDPLSDNAIYMRLKPPKMGFFKNGFISTT